MTDPDNLYPDYAGRLHAILGRSPKIAALAGHVHAFATIMRRLPGKRDLPQWIKGADADDLPGLRSFINDIRTDLDAVTNGLSPPYNSGRVECHDNRIKMIKRQMYGSANFDLLRRRILASI